MEILEINNILIYENNAKIHTEEQITKIANSISKFGYNTKIEVDENNVILTGHGRLLALKELGYTKVEVNKIKHLTENEKKAYRLADNKTNMLTEFDYNLLDLELNIINDFDMSDFGFDTNDFKILDENENGDVTLDNQERCSECNRII